MPSLLGLMLLGLAILWAAQRRMIYFPDGDPPAAPAVGLASAEVVAFTTEDGLRLEGWFVPARQPATGGTVLVFSGNAGNRAGRAPLAAALATRGIACLLVDYRGYGGNPGLPSEAGLTRDARAARAYLTQRPDVDPRKIVYFGESLGAAVAVRLATAEPPAALVLRSPFTSLADIGQHHYPFLPVRWLLRDRYPVLDLIDRVRAPVLVIAGGLDDIVPPGFSARVSEAAAPPKRLHTIPEAGHNDEALLHGPDLIDAIVTWLDDETHVPDAQLRIDH